MLFEMFPLPEKPKPAAEQIPVEDTSVPPEMETEDLVEDEEPDVSGLLVDQDES